MYQKYNIYFMLQFIVSKQKGEIFCGVTLLFLSNSTDSTSQLLKSFCLFMIIPDRLDDVEIRALWGPYLHFRDSTFFFTLKTF